MGARRMISRLGDTESAIYDFESDVTSNLFRKGVFVLIPFDRVQYVAKITDYDKESKTFNLWDYENKKIHIDLTKAQITQVPYEGIFTITTDNFSGVLGFNGYITNYEVIRYDLTPFIKCNNFLARELMKNEVEVKMGKELGPENETLSPHTFDISIDHNKELDIFTRYDGDFYLSGNKENILKVYCWNKMDHLLRPWIDKYGLEPHLNSFYYDGKFVRSLYFTNDYEESVEEYDKFVKKLKESEFARGVYEDSKILAYVFDIDALENAKKSADKKDLPKIDKYISLVKKNKGSFDILENPFLDNYPIKTTSAEDFCIVDDEWHPILGCVYYNNGYITASDTHILINYQAKYPARYEGKSIMSVKYRKKWSRKFPNYAKDEFTEGDYPNYLNVIPPRENMYSVKVDLQDMYNYVNKNIILSKMRIEKGTNIRVFIFDGDFLIGVYNAELLLKVIEGAKLIGADTMYYHDTHPTVFVKEEDKSSTCVLIMPMQDDLKEIRGNRVPMSSEKLIDFCKPYVIKGSNRKYDPKYFGIKEKCRDKRIALVKVTKSKSDGNLSGLDSKQLTLF